MCLKDCFLIMDRFSQNMLGFQSANCTLIASTFIDNQKNFTGSEQDRVDIESEKVMSVQS